MNGKAILPDLNIDALLPAPSVSAWSRKDVLQAMARAVHAEAHSRAVFDEAAIGRVLQMAHRAASCDPAERQECMEALHLTLSAFKVLSATTPPGVPSLAHQGPSRTQARAMSTVVALDVATRADEADISELRDAIKSLALAYRAQAPRGRRSVDLASISREAFKTACEGGFSEHLFVHFATSVAEAALPEDLSDVARSAYAEALVTGVSEAAFERLGRTVLSRMNEPVRALEEALR